MDKLIVVFLMIRISEGVLPKTAHRVESCPEANNITAWKEASAKLNCSDYSSKSIKNKLLYHCLPSSFLNETVEFCALSAAIPKGKCPIYNYENGATVATSRSCANFTNGCPSPTETPYHSNSFYRYFACWNINTKFKCYYADQNCQQDEMSYQTTWSNDQNIDISYSTTSNQATTLNDQHATSQQGIPVWIVIVLIIVIIILGGIVFAKSVRFCRLRRNKELYKATSRDDKERQQFDKKEYELQDINPEEEPLNKKKEDEGSSNGEMMPPNVGNYINDDETLDEKSAEHDDVEKESNIKDVVVVKNMATVKHEVEKSEKPESKDPKKDDDQPEKQDDRGKNCSRPSGEKLIENIVSESRNTIENDLLLFNSFYHNLAMNIMANTKIMASFKVLLNDSGPIEHDGSGDEMNLFLKWNIKHNFFLNIWHLQELLTNSRRRIWLKIVKNLQKRDCLQ